METKFQTSFVPKRPVPIGPIGGVMPSAPHARRHFSGIFMAVSSILFVVSLLLAGGSYLWQQYLLKAQTGYKSDLSTEEGKFDIDLISQLKAESTKLILAEQLLSNRVIYSRIFSVISKMTAENIRFISMDVASQSATSKTLTLSLTGYGKDFSAVAFQSDVLSQLKNYGLNKIVRNPIISNPVLNQNGTVTFHLSASLDTTGLTYDTSTASTHAATPQGHSSAQ